MVMSFYIEGRVGPVKAADDADEIFLLPPFATRQRVWYTAAAIGEGTPDPPVSFIGRCGDRVSGVVNLQVVVRDNNVDQALRALKKKMQREGIFREMKLRNFYEKPSEKKAREKAEAIRRARKLARKRAQREGLIPSKGRR